MASPGSPASSGGSKSYRDPDPYPPPAPGLEDLVSHFVAAKRALNIQTALWRANDMVTAARELLEENAILSAKNVSVRNIVDEQTDSLEAARRGMHLVQAEVQTEFESILQQVDRAFVGVQSTFAVLRETPIDPALQPPGTPQKHLYDFIDNAYVTHLKDSLRACIDRYNDARSNLENAKDAFDTSLDNLHSSIENVPVDLTTVHIPDYIPNQYCILEGHAKEAAQAFQMLVQHYDLCVTALRHTEGGSDAATEATGDAPQPSGDAVSAPLEPMSEEERREMLAVLHKDASEVEDVVSEIREHTSEMTFLLSQIETHIAHLRSEESALNSILRIMAHIAAEVKSHIAIARSFHASWLEDTRPTLLEGIDQWEQQREFYELFDLAYAKLIVEVASRRRRHEKAKRKAEEAQKELDKLYAEDERAREQFALTQGDFLPRDIWPGLSQPPRRYEVRAVGPDEIGEGDQTTMESIPQLARNAIERATARVQRSAR